MMKRLQLAIGLALLGAIGLTTALAATPSSPPAYSELDVQIHSRDSSSWQAQVCRKRVWWFWVIVPCTTPTATPTSTPPVTPTPLPPTATPVPPTATQTQTYLFDEEFDGGLGQWAVMDREGDWSNSEAQCYRPGNVSVSGGVLNIVSKYAPADCVGVKRSADPPSPGYALNYSSGMVMWPTLNFAYGHVDIRMKASGGTGPWPAAWFMGLNCQIPMRDWNNIGACNWPQPGSDEIDLAEFLNSDWAHVNQQIHTVNSGAGCKPSVSGTGWHVYSMDWTPTRLTFYVDGNQTCVITSNVPQSRMFLMLDVAMGGNGGGSINNATLPRTTQFDYVRVTPNQYTVQ